MADVKHTATNLRAVPRTSDATATPSVSIIIPVYNDAPRLARCLTALEAQTYPRSKVEVIVIDNGSTDDVAEVVGRFPEVRLLSELKPGSYAARNTGLQSATGEVVAFTDADCLPDPTWLANGVQALRKDPACGLVGGAIRVTFRSPQKPTLSELYDRIFDFDQERFIARGNFACTANVFSYTNLARKVGAFDGGMRSVGDRDYGNRVAAAGYELTFADDAVVAHPARPTIHDLLHKRLRVAGGHHTRALKRSWPRLRFLHAILRQVALNPFSGAARIWQKVPERSFITKLRILALYVFLCEAEAVERIRLQFGGEPRR
jgi:cellulose synthase/poly-beta-1,6-N-acetylglucosamine synthase-like glycosyltransferase